MSGGVPDLGLTNQRRHDTLPSVGPRKVMASPPTYTRSGPFTVATPAVASSVANSSGVTAATIISTPVFSFIGGTPSSAPGVLENYAQTSQPEFPAWQWDFWHEGQIMELFVWADRSDQSMLMLVDGEYTTLTPLQPVAAGEVNSSNFYTLKYDFGSRDVRNIRIIAYRLRLGRFFQGPSDSYWPSTVPDEPVIFLGDSLISANVAGAGYALPVEGFPFQLARLMRWGNPWLMGQGGTGYLNPGTGAKETLINRLDDVATIAPSVLVVAGGINDIPTYNAAYTAAALGAAVTAFCDQVKVQCPSVKKLYIVGAWQPRTGVSTTETANAHAAMATAAQAHAAVTAFISTTGTFTGTGKYGSTTGSGNQDFAVGSDGIHWQPEGHKLAAVRLAAAIRGAMRA